MDGSITWCKVYCGFFSISALICVSVSQWRLIYMVLSGQVTATRHLKVIEDDFVPDLKPAACANTARLGTVREYCNSRNRSESSDLANLLTTDIASLKNLLVNDEDGIIYCFIAKPECSVLTSMANLPVLESPSSSQARDNTYWRQYGLTQLDMYKVKDAQDRVENYHKVVVVGLPSKWLLPDNSRSYDANICLHDDTLTTQFSGMTENLTQEAVHKLVTRHTSHWSLGYEQCLPCDVTYNQVIKMETLMKDHVILPRKRRLSTLDVGRDVDLARAYDEISSVPSSAWRQELWERFQLNFKMFGYKLIEGQGLTCGDYTECGLTYGCV